MIVLKKIINIMKINVIIRIMTKYNNSGDKDSDRNRVYLCFDNDVENDEVNSKDDGENKGENESENESEN